MDPRGDGVGGLTATGLLCGSCGAELPPNSKFCNECGTRLTQATRSAEYKQVTVLFADVVRSMDIAAAVDVERLREIMTDLVERSAAVVRRYGGTVEYNGDGVMALFGAPVALEDHAIRACLAAMGVQEEAKRLAVEVRESDGVELQVRVGLNSGQVIAGEIGSGSLGYAAIGGPVGMAQRMESVAPPGGVMLSGSTARLVEHMAVLMEPEWMHIKGADEPVSARRLMAISPRDGLVGRAEASLVGRRWEMAALDAMVERTIGGRGGVVNVVGPPGIGKSRAAREAAALAAGRGVEVFWTFCESHARDVPFDVVAQLLRATHGVADLDGEAARAKVRQQIPDADQQDQLLLDDLLGIADPDMELPQIDPDARRRRLTALINTTSLARTEPALFIIEDVHWIDAVSESMLAEFLIVIPRTPSMVLITSRPEYEGALTRVPGAQTIALAPLGDSDTAALLGELLGPDLSVAPVTVLIAERAAGNPFFAEEMVRELAQRGVLAGERGGYLCRAEVADVAVPVTVQATIEARIDRLSTPTKRTLNVASVIGARFDAELLAALGIDAVLDELLGAELIDQVRFTPSAEYAFHHPLIRAVAYESQLKSDRAEVHRQLAAAIESGSPESADQNAALIAEHLQAAGDQHAAYGWHMRAGAWSANRDIAAASLSWERARRIADALPADDADRTAMRIEPRTLLAATAWQVVASGADPRFDELHDLCTAAGDQRSLAIGMTGLVMTHYNHAHRREASRLATEHVRLLESIGDPTLTVGLSAAALGAKYETGEMADVLRLAQRVIDLADGDPTMGNLILGSPLAVAIAMRGAARCCFGTPGWKDDFALAVEMAGALNGTSRAIVLWCAYVLAFAYGVSLPDATAVRETAAALALAERSGDDATLTLAQFIRAITLMHRRGPERETGFALLAAVREATVQNRFNLSELPGIDAYIAREKTRLGDLNGAIGLARTVLDGLFDSGGSILTALATSVVVESLLGRGTDTDIHEAQGAIDRLAAVPTDPGFVLHEITLLRLRALLARARGDENAYRDYRDRYRAMATSLGFEGHMTWAEAMP